MVRPAFRRSKTSSCQTVRAGAQTSHCKEMKELFGTASQKLSVGLLGHVEQRFICLIIEVFFGAERQDVRSILLLIKTWLRSGWFFTGNHFICSLTLPLRLFFYLVFFTPMCSTRRSSLANFAMTPCPSRLLFWFLILL